MKIAEVIPLYKNKEMDAIINYRPISLLITMSKVLEKIVYKRTYSYLEKNNILYNSQYGFRTNHNCEQAIMELTSKILHAKERGEQSVGVFLNLSKAFDTLNHTVLLSKLERLGICGIANEWFKDYLTGRSLVTKITVNESNIVYSEPYQIMYGTVQGSCLGPLLFILFCNDIYNLPLYSHLILFADDTTMINSHKNVNYLEYMMYHDLTILLDWFKANQLMHFWPGKRRIIISVDDIVIPQVTSCKFLGVYIDQNMSWNTQVEHLHNRITTDLHLLRDSKNVLNVDCLRKVYFVHIHSHLVYGLKVWGSMLSLAQIENLFKQQKQCMCILGNRKLRENVELVFKELNVLKFSDMVQLEVCKLGYQLKLKELPVPIIDEFNTCGGCKTHRYPTRHKDLPNIQKHQGTLINRNFICKGVSTFINLPLEIQWKKSKSVFT